jgi:hypothetical protein
VKRLFFAALAVLAVAGPFAARAADEWGLIGEEIARFEATVVDIRCELTGDCPAACGGGARQLGLLTGGGKLILAHKNGVAFAGATVELAPFCAKRVVADGLFATNRGVTVFALQFVRLAPDGKWRRANRFTNAWAEANGVAATSQAAKRWFRNDPRVQALIAEGGPLGLGPGVLPEE